MSTNAYVDANIVAGKIGSAAKVMGARNREMIQVYAKTASDTDNSILRFFKGLSPDLIITNIKVCNEAITGCSAVKVGFYGVLDYDNVGAIVGTGNQLGLALDLSGAHVSGSELSGISAVAAADRGKRIYELAGHTQSTKLPAYDLCLTLTTGGANTGNIAVIVSALD